MFEELNPEQRQAVLHRGGPLLVLAGAGSGKTRTLVARLAHLIGDGVRPERICLLTFSRRAAREMLTRAGRLAGVDAGRVWGGTFHATANRLLRRYGHGLGLSPSFTVMDQSDSADLMGLVRQELGLGAGGERGEGDGGGQDGHSGQGGHGGQKRFPRKATLISIYSRTVNSQSKLAGVLAKSFPWCADEIDGIKAVFEAYTARKRAQQALDFDDLLLCWRAVVSATAGHFDQVLVDEYQDTNTIQADILAGLRPGGDGLTAVGDDAQAIYSFRAASARNILDFPDHFPGTTVVRLEQNYRSTTPILAVANQVMAEAGEGYGKRLWSTRPGARRPLLRVTTDEVAQADAVCDSVLAHRDDGVDLRRQAVLFRAGHHSDLLELSLGRRNIPFVKYGGLKFLEAAHVKDLLALLRVLENPADELAWFRSLQLLEGVGPATARRLMGTLQAAAEADPGAPSRLAQFLAAPLLVPAAARAELRALREAWADCVGIGGADGDGDGGANGPDGCKDIAVDVQVGRLRRFLTPIVERAYDAPASRLADLEQLEHAAASFPTRGRLIGELVLDPPVSAGDLAGPPLLDDDWLVLSTVHSAKGGEWDVVHVIHAADGSFPSDMATGDADAIEEERRLFYVAVTRARDVLEINVPQRAYHRRHNIRNDDFSTTQLSRFLSPSVRSLMDEICVAAAPPALVTVDRSIADLW